MQVRAADFPNNLADAVLIEIATGSGDLQRFEQKQKNIAV
jgi:hypothetical protein